MQHDYIITILMIVHFGVQSVAGRESVAKAHHGKVVLLNLDLCAPDGVPILAFTNGHDAQGVSIQYWSTYYIFCTSTYTLCFVLACVARDLLNTILREMKI
jgi:hypothetical protein